MPNLPKRYDPGGTRQDRTRRYDGRRSHDRQFYGGRRWRKLRALKLAAQPLCEACDRKGKIVAANEVHHVIDRHARQDLAYEWENLESLCKPCHSAETARRQAKRTRPPGG